MKTDSVKPPRDGRRAGAGPLEYSALWQLTRARVMTFLREPEALFWVFAFPVLMALALGIAFRNEGQQTSRVGVESGPGAAAAVAALERSPDLEVVTLDPDEARIALRRGRIADAGPRAAREPPTALRSHAPGNAPRPPRRARCAERGAGREDVLHAESRTETRPGSRYIDFLIPGLIGLNMLGTGMWGIGYAIASARQQKLLKRMVATPMRKGHYLLAFMLARLVWLALEVAAVQGFGWLAFGVAMRGSWLGYVVVCLLSALTFAAMGILVASRTKTIEGVSGLMNLVMLPMWLLSGVFFSSERFPAAMQPFIKALPLTASNDALRLLTNEGAHLGTIVPQLGVLLVWGAVSFYLGLRLFRWE